ncbi:Penicillin-insensitive murein endopeptidase [Erwinia amylovora MR1]|nr:Penicillin-insensitive murein endopeptidase [Erwinia amylovora MR1]
MKKMLAALLLCATTVRAATPWQTVYQPVSGAPQSIGGFANGCIIGAQPLPLDAAGYQVMRSDQRRFLVILT